ncbi:MAG: hypothetical protein HOP23_03880 [Methylococcaceae bacterium]|nr:hypothetical protein [Methylococcaceae bacterium]
MKILFFFLALANAAFFMWEFHKGAFAPDSKTSIDKSNDYQEQIVLISELEADNPLASQSNKVPSPVYELDFTDRIDKKPGETEFISEKLTDSGWDVPETSTLATTRINPKILSVEPVEEPTIICYEAGPFANEQVFKIWENRLNGFIASVSKEVQTVKDYLVYFPAAETLMLSQANLQMLKEKGITDLWLLTQGAEQGQISLGIFNREEKALIMKNELLAKGITAEVKARYKSKVQKFAVIRAEVDVTDNLEFLKIQHPKVIVKAINTTADNNCLKAINQ